MVISNEIVVGIITAAGVILAAGISVVVGNVGWRSSIKKDIELFHALYPLVDSGQEEVDLEVFRKRVFRRLNKAISARFRNLKEFLYWFISDFVLSLPIGVLLGLPLTEHQVLINLVVAFVIAAIITGGHELLKYWPKIDANPIYKQARMMREADAVFKAFFATLEEEHRREGWVSNYALFEKSKKAEWGYVDAKQADNTGECEVSCDEHEGDVESSHDVSVPIGKYDSLA